LQTADRWPNLTPHGLQESMNSGHALIIGGSLGGLFAAHFLRAAGWRVDVFERSSEDLAGRGAGLGTHAALARMLRRLGIATDAELGIHTRYYVWLDADGKVACRLDNPRIMTAWSWLYRPLKDALPAQHYHPAKSFVAAEQDADGVTALFADGTRARGDLLVAADGPRSTVRPQVLRHVKPDYAGYIAWRGLIAEAEVGPADHDMLFESNAYCVPDGELAISYPVPGRDGDLRPGKRDYNIVWYRPTDTAALADLNTDASGRRHETIPPPLIRPDVIAAVKADARALLAPCIADGFARAAQPIFQPIHDFASPQLVFGRIALLGDAAFVARPHVGAGVTKAGLDAECLADALVGNSSIEAALAVYNDARQRSGTWAVSRSRAFGACVSAEVARSGLSAAESARRSERVFRENATLHIEVGEWAKEAASSVYLPLKGGAPGGLRPPS
jgi:2-polyprenyl-6-methoxyphenol hydroxylase-like FAD-dependent oxidoreductase